ncbi:flagellin [Pseudomonadales bacterium]|nr:flagellin [Pseudomonadales bacterium]
MSVINTNVSAILTQNALAKNERAMSGAMEQLSTGKRINSASDDAAGLAISSRMTSQINGLNQGVRNANDAISLIQTADGALIEVTNMLQRMRTLAVQAASDTNAAADVTALQAEFALLRTEIDRIGSNTQWNGENVLDESGGTSGTYAFQVGANATQQVSVAIQDYTTSGDISGIDSLDISTSITTANAAITAVDTAIATVNSGRATMGATINVLQYAADNLANVSLNATASRSRVEDIDYSSATTELARTQIIAQAATAMLAQANQMPQTVLSLLK